MNYWYNQGCQKEKLIVGVPVYGRTFTLINVNRNDLHSPCNVTGLNPETNLPLYSGLAGTYTREPGYLSYYEVR